MEEERASLPNHRVRRASASVPLTLLLMLEQAGFADVEVQGDHNDAPATSEDDFIVFVARK